MIIVTLGIIVGFICVYLTVGLLLFAPRHVTREMERNCRKWPTLVNTQKLAEWRRTASFEGIFVGVFWPFFAVGRLVARLVDGRAPLSDPELRFKAEEQRRRIADLERELRIDKRQ